MVVKGRGAIIIIIIRTFVTRAVSANILNLRRRQSLGEEDGNGKKESVNEWNTEMKGPKVGTEL